MDKRRMGWPLERKEEESEKIIQKAVQRFGEDKVAAAFGGGKDATVVLHLIRQVFGSKVLLPVVCVDIPTAFREIGDFTERIAIEWQLDLIRFQGQRGKLSQVKGQGDYLSMDPLKKVFIENKWEALITGIRWDEEKLSSNEKYFSRREDPMHTRVHPILHFRELDVWSYIRKYDLPYCELYRKGYKSLRSALYSERDNRELSTAEQREVEQRLKDLGYL